MSKKLFLLSGIVFALVCNTFAQEELLKTSAVTTKTSQAEPRKKVTPADAVQNALKIGDEIPEFSLEDSNGKVISSSELLQKGNLVVVFYSGAWCAECNSTLQKLQKNLSKIRAENADVVIIAAEMPVRSQMVARKYKVGYTFLSDPNLLVSRKFGIVYDLPDEINKKYKEDGLNLANYNQTKTVELPLNAAYIVNQNGQITFASITENEKNSVEPDEIIETLAKMKKN